MLLSRRLISPFTVIRLSSLSPLAPFPPSSPPSCSPHTHERQVANACGYSTCKLTSMLFRHVLPDERSVHSQLSCDLLVSISTTEVRQFSRLGRLLFLDPLFLDFYLCLCSRDQGSQSRRYCFLNVQLNLRWKHQNSISKKPEFGKGYHKTMNATSSGQLSKPVLHLSSLHVCRLLKPHIIAAILLKVLHFPEKVAEFLKVQAAVAVCV